MNGNGHSLQPRELVGVHENARVPPASIMSTSPVPMYHSGQQLPLSLILLITSHLDNVRDLANVIRASRLLYYLNLPRLYENVTLHSFPHIRYIDGRPEGFGAGSPFAMALNGLVSRNVGRFVKSLTLKGKGVEGGEDEFEKGRIPDNTMMLNIVIRAAIERMDILKELKWELNSNPMKTVYQGLASRSTLTTLTLRFPSSRTPRPTVLIPGIPSLEYLHLMGMDPLCYNDDPSLLLLQSRKLTTLKLEWSPRMRREREPTVQLNHFFGRCYQAHHHIPARHFAMKNLFCRRDEDMESALDPCALESVCMINCIDPSDPTTVFVDSTWTLQPDKMETFKRIKRIRMDRLDQRESSPMQFCQALEEIYLVDRDRNLAKTAKNTATTTTATNGIPNGAVDGPTNGHYGSIDKPSPQTPFSAEHAKALKSMASEYLAAIIRLHGSSLRKLLLSAQWALSELVLKNLLIECPKLEELGVAIKGNDIDIAHAVIKHSPNLKALRILLRPGDPFMTTLQAVDIETQCIGMGARLKGPEWANVKFLGVGELCFELGGLIKIRDPTDTTTGLPMRELRLVKPVGLNQVQEMNIWRLDNLEL